MNFVVVAEVLLMQVREREESLVLSWRKVQATHTSRGINVTVVGPSFL